MHALVRALCVVKLAASNRIWPHIHAAGRSRFAPGIGYPQGAERYSGRITGFELALTLRRALAGRLATWESGPIARGQGCTWGAGT
jgi:hypothetical protein